MTYKKKVLPNGLRVVTIHLADTPTVTVLVMVEAGSKYETKDKNGISHFLEHMCFKGTEARPTAFHISKELDAIGSHYNAFTSEEFTGYYAKAAAKHGVQILDVISDLYLNQTFPEAEIEKEKGVIVEEINMYNDLPHRRVQELFMELLYGDQPAGWSITGTRETVKAMRREDFIYYRTHHYVPEATTVIVSGSFDEEQMQDEIAKRFGPIEKTPKAEKSAVIERQAKPEVKIEFKQIDQAHLVVGVRGFPISHPDTPALRVLNGVLGAGMSSRLFQKLREEMGVGYYVRSSYDAYTDHGALSVSIGSDIKRVEEALQAIMDEFRRLTAEPVSDEELLKTKENLTGTMYLGLESTDAIAEFYGYQEVLRRDLRTPEQIADEIRKVTAADILAVAKKIFTNDRLNLAVVGPCKDEEALKKLLAF